MKDNTYTLIEDFMISSMDKNDIGHDQTHVYRVIKNAFHLKENYELDLDVLVASCLLHDIARVEESKDSKINHADLGSLMAYDFLISIGWPPGKADQVKYNIKNHSKKLESDDISIEGQILYDSDKLDVIGAIGIARVISYCSHKSTPIQSLKENDFTLVDQLSVYDYDFENNFYTDQARILAKEKLQINETYLKNLSKELNQSVDLKELLK